MSLRKLKDRRLQSIYRQPRTVHFSALLLRMITQHGCHVHLFSAATCESQSKLRCLGSIQELRNAVGVGGFPEKKRCEYVWFNVSVTRRWVDVNFPEKSVTQHLNCPLRANAWLSALIYLQPA